MADLKNKRVITAAVCGSWPTKDMNPAVPYSPQEIAREAYECWLAGAAIVVLGAVQSNMFWLNLAVCAAVFGVGFLYCQRTRRRGPG